MNKIIDIEDLRKRFHHQRDRTLKEERLKAIYNFIQCASCSFKCAMCGIHTENNLQEQDSAIEYPLCSACRAEYKSYLQVANGQSSDILWHNTEWFEMWSSWIRYRKSLKRFLDSDECRLLFQ